MILLNKIKRTRGAQLLNTLAACSPVRTVTDGLRRPFTQHLLALILSALVLGSLLGSGLLGLLRPACSTAAVERERTAQVAFPSHSGALPLFER